MADRVAAEVVEAAGLGDLCVGKNEEDTLEKLRQYKLSLELQKRAVDHLNMLIDRRLGLFNTERTPVTWKTVLDFYLQTLRDTGGDRAKLLDFNIPQQVESLAPVMAVNTHSSAASVDEIIRQLQGTERGMEGVTRDLLTGFALETGAVYIGVTGTGSFVNAICCRLPDGKRGAFKLSKESRDKNRIHNDPNMREAALLLAAHAKMRKGDVKVFPEPYFVLENNTSFAGVTAPDARGRVLSFLFCEFVEKDLMSTAAHHANTFQQTGTFNDSVRVQLFCPFLLALHHAHAKGFFILDIKPDNVRIREDGSVVFTDLNLGHMIPSNIGKGRETAQGMPCLLNRRCTTLLAQEHADATGHKMKPPPKGLFRSPRQRQGSLFVPITRAALRIFWQKASMTGLADLGGGNRVFQDPKNTPAAGKASATSRRKYIIGADRSKSLDRKWARDADLYAAFFTLLLLLTRRKGEAILGWKQRAIEATAAGNPGIRNMFLDSMNGNVIVQQELALAKMVDMFAGALGPGKRLSEQSLLTHVMNTTPILKPEHDQILRGGGSIPVGGGFVRDFFNCPYPDVRDKKIPLLGFALQGKMGMGVRAEEEVNVGDVVGLYIGKFVLPSVLGGESAVTPSRYHINSQGDIPLLKELGITKLGCDAQADGVYDFDWALINCNSGPYFNAGRGRRVHKASAALAAEAGSTDAEGSDDEDDKGDVKANCKVDRVRVWGFPTSREGPFPELVCHLMFCTHYVPKGGFLMWEYDPDAGPEYSFSPCYRD
jgi:hypothetical protein